MSAKTTSIPATLNIDPAALAALAPAMPGNLADLLADVKALLIDVRERLEDGGKLLLDRNEAAARLGVSSRTLQDLPIPSLLIGTCRRWHVADLLEFIEHQKQTGGVKS